MRQAAERKERRRNGFARLRRQLAPPAGPQGSVLRFLLREGVDATDALQVLDSVTGHRRHDFWPDDVPFTGATLRGVIGHRQVTDAYLAAQARRRGGKVATLDKGLARSTPTSPCS